MTSLTTIDLFSVALHLVEDLEESGGELSPAMEARLAAFGDGVREKLAALHALCLRLEVEQAALDAEAKRIADRARSWGRARDRVKALAQSVLEAHERVTGESKVAQPRVTAWLQANPPALEAPEDVTAWPAEFVELRPHAQWAKALAALKDGREIPGFRLVQGRGMRWK